jgi:hypothetical protein
MKSFKEHIEEEQGLRLTHEEKGFLRASLEVHMQAHPLARVKSPWMQWRHISQFALAPLALLLVCTGTAYAAQGALPGDLLYPLKINVTEQVEVALATTPAAQVAVQTKLAAERVSEAQTLADQGKLDATTTEELQDNFDSHASAALAIAEQTGDASTSEATTSVAVATSSVVVDTLAVVTIASTTAPVTATSTPQENTNAVVSLETSLTLQSNVLKALKLRVEAKTKASSGESASSTPDDLGVQHSPHIPKHADEATSTESVGKI